MKADAAAGSSASALVRPCSCFWPLELVLTREICVARQFCTTLSGPCSRSPRVGTCCRRASKAHASCSGTLLWWICRQVRRHCCAVRCHDELDQIGQIIVRKLWRRHHHRRLERYQLAHLPHSQRRHQTDNYRIIRSHHRCCHVLFLQGSGCNKKVRRLDVVKSRQYDKLGRVTAAKLET